jgi:hypothetical protein
MGVTGVAIRKRHGELRSAGRTPESPPLRRLRRSSLGPRAVIHTPEVTSDGNLTSGGITGRTVDFTIGWSGTLAYVHFTGTVGADGIAHGTSTGTTTPINLNEGPWDSVGPLTCS